MSFSLIVSPPKACETTFPSIAFIVALSASLATDFIIPSLIRAFLASDKAKKVYVKYGFKVD